jgi:archaellum biogenesis ATPase FlaH
LLFPAINIYSKIIYWYYLTVNIDSREEQQIPIDYLTVNIDSWEEQRIPIDYLTVNIDSREEQQIDNLLVFVALLSYQYLQ